MESTVDLYGRYARLCADDPVHQTARGVWLLTRYDDVCAALRDPRLGRQGIIDSIAPPDGRRPLAYPMRFQDPPGYIRLRNLVGKVFTHDLVDGLRSRIERIVDGLLDSARRAGGMEVIADFGLTLAVQVILDLLGVPVADHERFRGWSRDMTQSLDAAAGAASARGAAAQSAIDDYFGALIAERRQRPRDDLITALLAAGRDGDGLRDAELLDICGLLFVAGHLTAVDLIGNGVLNLLLHRSELCRLRREPGLVAAAVEELLRFESPVQRVGRMANADVALRGKLIPKGAVVFAVLGAANRDPAHYDAPDCLDLGRRHSRPVAFGHGVHACIGAALARLEGQIAIGTLVARLPQLALVDETPQWRESADTRGLRELRVAL
jgi:pimeloyl-[acyl-carrier protein] synthase